MCGDLHRAGGQHTVLHVQSVSVAWTPPGPGAGNQLRSRPANGDAYPASRVRAQVLVSAEAGAVSSPGILVQDSSRCV